jgi:hypothetical protein
MSSTTLSKESLLNLYYTLKSDIPSSGYKLPTRFTWVCNYNIDALEPICKTIAESTKSGQDAEYNKYIKEMIDTIKPYAKVEDGKISLSKTGLPLIKKECADTVMPLVFEISNKYKAVIDKKKDEDEEISNLLKDNITVDIVKIGFKFLPDFLTQYQMNSLKPMIQESDEEIKSLLNDKP